MGHTVVKQNVNTMRLFIHTAHCNVWIVSTCMVPGFFEPVTEFLEHILYDTVQINKPFSL